MLCPHTITSSETNVIRFPRLLTSRPCGVDWKYGVGAVSGL